MVNTTNLTVEMPQNATQMSDLMVWANGITPFAYLILLAIYMVSFLYLSKTTRGRTFPSLIGAGFTTMISSYLLYIPVGMFGSEVPLALTVATMGMATMYYLNKK